MDAEFATFALLATIWAFDPGPNALYFALRSGREGAKAVLPVALGTALFNAFVILLVLIGFTGLAGLGAGAYVLKALVALGVIWLVGLNLFNIYNVRNAAKMRVRPAPVRLTPKEGFRRFGSGIAWGAMNPVNIAVFALIVPNTQTESVSTDMLGTYTLTLLGLNMAGLLLCVLGQKYVRKFYRVGWLQAPVHIIARGTFIVYAGLTIYGAGLAVWQSLGL